MNTKIAMSKIKLRVMHLLVGALFLGIAPDLHAITGYQPQKSFAGITQTGAKRMAGKTLTNVGATTFEKTKEKSMKFAGLLSKLAKEAANCVIDLQWPKPPSQSMQEKVGEAYLPYLSSTLAKNLIAKKGVGSVKDYLATIAKSTLAAKFFTQEGTREHTIATAADITGDFFNFDRIIAAPLKFSKKMLNIPQGIGRLIEEFVVSKAAKGIIGESFDEEWKGKLASKALTMITMELLKPFIKDTSSAHIEPALQRLYKKSKTVAMQHS